MSIAATSASKWPARAAFVAAGIFVSASAGINLQYGWAKGSDPITSAIWAAVAGAVAIVFTLSWAATIRAVESRRWATAVMCIAALVLSGAYSISAALGSASGGRTNAAALETASSGARARAQAAYDAAQADLATLAPSRPLPEIQALVDTAKPRCRIVVENGRRDTQCTKPGNLLAELGRAQRRAELEAKIETEAAKLATAGPARQANSDAKALARFIAAVGLDIGTDRLNDLLVLLAVAMVECGGGLALAVGMALGAPPVRATDSRANAGCPEPEHPKPAPALALDAANGQAGHFRTDAPDAVSSGVRPASVQVSADRPLTVQPSDLMQWLAVQGGRAETSMRRLASALGRSPSGVHEELRRLAASGVITLAAGPRGTAIALRPN